MTQPVRRRIAAILTLAVGGLASRLPAAILYSNLQGNYVAQQTSSITLNKGTSNASGTNTIDYGATGIGDDYNVDPTLPTTIVNGVPSVLLAGISFYGNLTPSAGDPAGSLGASALMNFYNAAGVRYPQSVNITSQFQGGIGLHTFLFNPAYVPATGSFTLSPALFSLNGGFGSTPKSYGDLTLAAFFGSAPTVGTGNPLTYARTDTNGAFSVSLAQANSPAYLQFALIGVPEPTSLAIVSVVAGTASLRRRRPTC